MRIYIEPAVPFAGTMTPYYLLDNVERFALHRNGRQSSVSIGSISDSLMQIKPVENVDEKTATRAIE